MMHQDILLMIQSFRISKSRQEKLLPEYNFVYRYGWDTYRKNVDMYGNPKDWTDSIETAIDELIHDENVDTIIVSFTEALLGNVTQYGDEWHDTNGKGVSAIPGKTYKDCVENLTDGVGPETAEDLNTFLANKPWEKHWEHSLPFFKRSG